MTTQQKLNALELANTHEADPKRKQDWERNARAELRRLAAIESSVQGGERLTDAEIKAEAERVGVTHLNEYGSTDLPYDIIGVDMKDGEKRLARLLLTALGARHPAIDDFVALLMSKKATQGAWPDYFTADQMQSYAREAVAQAVERERETCAAKSTGEAHRITATLQPQNCHWTYQDDETEAWATGCGEMWCFVDGGPKENNTRYCHGCGKPVSIMPNKQVAAPIKGWAELHGEAQRIVESSPLWKRFIDGTPLSNDIACWMVDFALAYRSNP
jgi:hypothetical protein